MSDTLNKRFSAYDLSLSQRQAAQSVRDRCLKLTGEIEMLVPDGVALEQVMFWANAGIARSKNG